MLSHKPWLTLMRVMTINFLLYCIEITNFHTSEIQVAQITTGLLSGGRLANIKKSQLSHSSLFLVAAAFNTVNSRIWIESWLSGLIIMLCVSIILCTNPQPISCVVRGRGELVLLQILYLLESEKCWPWLSKDFWSESPSKCKAWSHDS